MLNDRIFHIILSVPQNTAMGINNVMATLENQLTYQWSSSWPVVITVKKKLVGP